VDIFKIQEEDQTIFALTGKKFNTFYYGNNIFGPSINRISCENPGKRTKQPMICNVTQLLAIKLAVSIFRYHTLFRTSSQVRMVFSDLLLTFISFWALIHVVYRISQSKFKFQSLVTKFFICFVVN